MTSQYSPREYWSEIADTYGQPDGEGLAPVLHPNVPDWYNRAIDALQFRAVLRGLEVAKLVAGMTILDVGCGTGRWLRRFENLGFRPAGLDMTVGMLSLARKNLTRSPLVGGESFRLPFNDATFDAVSDITVVQHQPHSCQPQAIAEMLRVIKPGGKLILMELIRGKGDHIFPRSPQAWINGVTSFGASLIGWFGEEFMLLDRAFVNFSHLFVSKNLVKTNQPRGRVHLAHELYWNARRVVTPLSAQLDPILGRVCPQKFATHGVFIFGK
jgi:SAM-dependent methyltransferase